MTIIYEYEQYEMPRLTAGATTMFDQNLDLRVRYILKELGETLYKTEMYRRDKERNKRTEQAMVSTTFIQIMSDLLNRLSSIKDKKEFHEIKKEIEQGCIYINQLFLDISKAYDCTVPRIETLRTAITRVKFKSHRVAAKQDAA
jgi:hypothetical protein